ncbi:DNA-3-methyladenine glycosylase I [Solemya elarraichensis gill symbiont]|uniref:DNA-3-methyladenine glycosylase I n=1 Tax=Solemya elarraichensis gill symbiont TaxID=1918949 RepID=A0A1T2KYZ2_9GAMM|nr:DNA-3-methyladenine glycosylase I [Solemya elarraichensis gill symbiont]OOZ37936.1 DNA-3-methyladenine glycosylase [Solemya elarraichensis gill symbiont]
MSKKPTTDLPHRCTWCGDDPLYVAYHDNDWGVSVHDDRKLFEMLTLEGAQAGLSWITILRKRENYKLAFDNFDIDKVAAYDDSKLESLMGNAGIVRNRLKISSTIDNARAVQKIRQEHGSLDTFLWSFVDGETRHNRWKTLAEIPAQTELSVQLSKALKGYGCRFVGPTICYALMQSIGMVNDHTTDCFRHRKLITLTGTDSL